MHKVYKNNWGKGLYQGKRKVFTQVRCHCEHFMTTATMHVICPANQHGAGFNLRFRYWPLSKCAGGVVVSFSKISEMQRILGDSDLWGDWVRCGRA